MATAKEPASILAQFEALPETGHWLWNHEENHLEFFSYLTSNEKTDKGKNKKKEANAWRKKYPKGELPGPRIPQPGDTVSIYDIKIVAARKLNNSYPVDAFMSFFSTKEFDSFLFWLLVYYSRYLEKKEGDQRAKRIIGEGASVELERRQLWLQLEACSRLVTKKYCTLAMGIPVVHHMLGGSSHLSDTDRDRELYETFYMFIVFAVWITFRHPNKNAKEEYDIVSEEINRFLRSDKFNPATRLKYVTENENETLTERRARQKLIMKRPGVMRVIKQKSPALQSLIACPQDLVRDKLLKGEKLTQTTEAEEDVMEGIMNELLNNPPIELGILNRPLREYNINTLQPIPEESKDKSRSRISKRGETSASSNKSVDILSTELHSSRIVSPVPSDTNAESPGTPKDGALLTGSPKLDGSAVGSSSPKPEVPAVKVLSPTLEITTVPTIDSTEQTSPRPSGSSKAHISPPQNDSFKAHISPPPGDNPTALVSSPPSDQPKACVSTPIRVSQKEILDPPQKGSLSAHSSVIAPGIEQSVSIRSSAEREQPVEE